MNYKTYLVSVDIYHQDFKKDYAVFDIVCPIGENNPQDVIDSCIKSCKEKYDIKQYEITNCDMNSNLIFLRCLTF